MTSHDVVIRYHMKSNHISTEVEYLLYTVQTMEGRANICSLAFTAQPRAL